MRDLALQTRSEHLPCSKGSLDSPSAPCAALVPPRSSLWIPAAAELSHEKASSPAPLRVQADGFQPRRAGGRQAAQHGTLALPIPGRAIQDDRSAGSKGQCGPAEEMMGDPLVLPHAAWRRAGPGHISGSRRPPSRSVPVADLRKQQAAAEAARRMQEHCGQVCRMSASRLHVAYKLRPPYIFWTPLHGCVRHHQLCAHLWLDWSPWKAHSLPT